MKPIPSRDRQGCAIIYDAMSNNPKKFVFSRRAPDLPPEVAAAGDAAAEDAASLFEPRDVSIGERLVGESRWKAASGAGSARRPRCSIA